MDTVALTHFHPSFEDMLCEARALVRDNGWATFRFNPSTIVLMRGNHVLTITCSENHKQGLRPLVALSADDVSFSPARAAGFIAARAR